MRTETRASDETLRITELDCVDDSLHYMIEGVGSNFELINNLVEEFSDGNQILYFARY